MQNRYVGDIGDFGKYGLLREIFGRPGIPGTGCGLSLGIVWYLNQGESNNDGKFTDYANLKDYDSGLYNTLQRLIATNQRNVSAVRQSKILPKNTLYYEPFLPHAPNTSQDSRLKARQVWLDGALKETEKADVVFIDPDNGITSETTNSPKHVLVSELRRFYQRGQSLVVYHHVTRQSSAVQQLKRVSRYLQKNLCLANPFWALWYHRGTARFYFIVTQERHESILEENLGNLLNGKWGAHFDGFKCSSPNIKGGHTGPLQITLM